MNYLTLRNIARYVPDVNDPRRLAVVTFVQLSLQANENRSMSTVTIRGAEEIAVEAKATWWKIGYRPANGSTVKLTKVPMGRR